MTFVEKYQRESTWHAKVIVMEIYHLTMNHRSKGWTLKRTAEHFNVSIGLVSENLRLAHALHINDKLLKCESRNEALKKLNGRNVEAGHC